MPYSNANCAIGTTCTIPIEIPTAMTAPIYMYYRLEGFYQNYRLYVKSRYDNQLQGRALDSSSLNTACYPRDVVGNLTIYPCGFIAGSVFTGACGNRACDAVVDSCLYCSSSFLDLFVFIFSTLPFVFPSSRLSFVALPTIRPLHRVRPVRRRGQSAGCVLVNLAGQAGYRVADRHGVKVRGALADHHVHAGPELLSAVEHLHEGHQLER